MGIAGLTMFLETPAYVRWASGSVCTSSTVHSETGTPLNRFHVPGRVVTGRPELRLDAGIFGKAKRFLLRYEYANMLEYNGTRCSADETYSKDDCVLSWANERILGKVGCTVPFLPGATTVIIYFFHIPHQSLNLRNAHLS